MIPLKDDHPSRTVPLVTVAFLAANVLVFVHEATLPAEALRAFVFRMGVVPTEIVGGAQLDRGFPAPVTLLTSMFVHGGLAHLLGNMLYLWIFGNNVEDVTGHVGFAAFYLLCGLAAAATQIAVLPGSPVPMVGASGAIAGVLGAYMVLFPRARVLTLVPIIILIRLVWLPAGLLLGLWFLMQVVMSGGPAGAGVAFHAHIGGFVAGLVLIWIFRRRVPRSAR